MAQLPPKIPSNNSTHTMHPNWADEFAVFAAARRSTHRRSLSGTVTFVEAAEADFDRLDDDQLMSMFPDEAPPPPAQALSPCQSNHDSVKCVDHNNSDDNSAEMAGQEEKSNCERSTACPAKQGGMGNDAAGPPVVAQRVKRILANRKSAQRSRVRKLHYISELERSVTTLQNEVSVLSPRVAFLDQQRFILTVGNSYLKQRIAALAQEKIFKDAHQDALRKEIERLRQVYHQQNLKKMASDPPVCEEKELLC